MVVLSEQVPRQRKLVQNIFACVLVPHFYLFRLYLRSTCPIISQDIHVLTHSSLPTSVQVSNGRPWCAPFLSLIFLVSRSVQLSSIQYLFIPNIYRNEEPTENILQKAMDSDNLCVLQEELKFGFQLVRSRNVHNFNQHHSSYSLPPLVWDTPHMCACDFNGKQVYPVQ